MRIATYNILNNVQYNLNNIEEKQAKEQYQLATGKQFNKASENPIAAKQAEIINQTINKVDQYQKNVNDAQGILQTSASILQNSYGILQSTNDEVLKALNGTYNQSDLQTISTVIDNSIQQLVSAGNTKYLNRYIFSGQKILTQPFNFDGTTLTYSGNDTDMKMQISPSQQTTVGYSGNEAFTNVINNLITIRDQIKAGDRTGLATSHAQLLTNMDDLMNKVSEMGTSLNGLNNTNEDYISQKTNLQTRLSSVQDTDFTQVMIDYTQTQQTYSATLKATSMMFQNSILNYM